TRMTDTHYKVGVIGGGAWGTALSILANRAGSEVTLCTRNLNVIQAIQERRTNDAYLPGVFIDPAITLTDKLIDICRHDLIILAAPSHTMRSVCIALSDLLPTNIPIMIACKGIERGSLMLMGEIAKSILPKNPLSVISGPNFADEAARGLPTATTIACAEQQHWDMLVQAIGGRLFRPYLIAIACGIAIGKNFGENARAAIVTRGFMEMARLTIAKGGKHETLMGLSGMGDLILTCGSTKSRNMSFGMAIGQGKNKDEVLLSRGRTATEGVIAAESVHKLAKKLGVAMPITEAVYHILYENSDVHQTVDSLLGRPFGAEAL
ncbi:MAG: NAD(P)-dependent glycerol-3-phosphate dehydrogenase, partial [Proteobacteria bacterium]|nr:NAD(P)-dependent glycerol-3-phosphate dehydrogenase [Pseudomonadota bacterium]